MKWFSLCAGEQVRMDRALGGGYGFKQFIRIHDEPLIVRQYRQVQERGGDLIVVTHHQPIAWELVPHGAKYTLYPERRRYTVETLHDTFDHWPKSGRVAVLLGDVYYTDETLDRIQNCQLPIGVFGDRHEVYALSFTRKKQVHDALLRTIRAADQGECKGSLRNLYHTLTNQDYRQRTVTDVHGNWIEVEDDTTDFDVPGDLGKISRIEKEPAR
jgi:hypothetical protein